MAMWCMVKMANSSETSAASVMSVDSVCVDSDQEPDAAPPTFLSAFAQLILPIYRDRGS